MNKWKFMNIYTMVCDMIAFSYTCQAYIHCKKGLDHENVFFLWYSYEILQ